MTNAGSYGEVRQKLRRSSGRYCEIVNWLEESLEGNSLSAIISWIFTPEYKLGVEADGCQHFEDRGRERHEVRAKELSKLGVEILRFNDNEILGNINEVCEVIQKALSRKIDPLTSVLSPMGRGD